VKDKENSISFLESMRLTVRTLGVMNRFSPGFIPSIILNGFFSTVTPFVTMYLSALLIDELAGARRSDVIWRLILITIAVRTVLSLVGYLFERWTKAWQAKFDMQSFQYNAAKMLELDYVDVDSQRTRDLYNRIFQANNYRGFGYYMVLWGFQVMVTGLSGIVGAIALTVSLFTTPVPTSGGALTVLNSPIFALIFAALFAIVALLYAYCNGFVRDREENANEIAFQANRTYFFFGTLGTTRHGHRSMDIRMYNQQNIAQHELFRAHRAYTMKGVFGKICYGKPGILMAVASSGGAILTGAAYVLVCLKALGGAFGIGLITQYVGALTALTGSLADFLESLLMFRKNAPYLHLQFEYLDIPNSMYQGSLTTEKRSDRQYEVEFKDVSFRYPGSDLWALRHVNMKFKVGKRLAIVGENGSGKTTFIKLLCRLYDPQEGQILLNGIDIRKYRYDDYMNIFAVVFQDFQLISQPLGNNVAGASEYDRERARKALIDAGFGDRLESLPDGLDTQLYKDFGIDGIEVSGGEAQKIAIARALYKDAPFIILDEPTAALDPMAEAEIYSKFNEISGDKTAIYISHRLSSCKFCDEIAVFHEGAVIQQGTHAELVADETGKYHALWNAQAQYYTEKTAETLEHPNVL